MEGKISMTIVKQKVKNITINRLFQKEDCMNEMYSALRILLNRNYKKYEFETDIEKK